MPACRVDLAAGEFAIQSAPRPAHMDGADQDDQERYGEHELQ